MEDTLIAPAVARDVAAPSAKPRWRDLREWLELVEDYGSLRHIDSEVDPEEELAAIAWMTTRRPSEPALLFEKFVHNPLNCRVLINILGASKERYALAVGIDPEMSLSDMVQATRHLVKQRIPPIYVAKDKAPVNEVVWRDKDIDLTKFPAPKFWPADGGAFIGTGGITLTRHPDGGRINVGVYRQQLFEKNRIGLNCVPGRHGLADCEAAWAQGKPAEIVSAFGIDPVLFMVGSQRFGPNESELDAAGGIMGQPVELTTAEFVSLPIPARAEIVIEGLVHPGDVQTEGPLGEFHGFYSGGPKLNPVIEVKAVHFRRNPILTAALMANYPSSEVGEHHSLMRSARIYDDLDRIGIPGIKAVYCHPAAAGGACMAVVSLKQMYVGHASQALALTAQSPAATYYTKWIIAVDDDVDPTNFDDVVWAMSTRCNPADDIDFIRNTMSFRADPSLAPNNKPHGSKILINACAPYRWINQQPMRTFLRKSVYDRVAKRWGELKLPGRPPQVKSFFEENSSPQDAVE
jgi:UbiD family decarboxylase